MQHLNWWQGPLFLWAVLGAVSMVVYVAMENWGQVRGLPQVVRTLLMLLIVGFLGPLFLFVAPKVMLSMVRHGRDDSTKARADG